MGHRDLLVTHNLSNAGHHHRCQPHPRGSVRRRAASFWRPIRKQPNQTRNVV